MSGASGTGPTGGRPAAPARRGPGRPRREDQRDTREIVLRAATALFAEHGFDAVGVRDVAQAAGVNVATVHHHVGSKVELYEACFARIFAAERDTLAAALEPAVASLDAGPEAFHHAIHALVDTFVDFLEDRPETTALWLQRWLRPRAQESLSTRYAHPLYERIEELLARADALGLVHEPTPHQMVRSLVWAVHGHVVETGSARQADGAARARRELRSFLHRWLDALYPPAAD